MIRADRVITIGAPYFYGRVIMLHKLLRGYSSIPSIYIYNCMHIIVHMHSNEIFYFDKIVISCHKKTRHVAVYTNIQKIEKGGKLLIYSYDHTIKLNLHPPS